MSLKRKSPFGGRKSPHRNHEPDSDEEETQVFSTEFISAMHVDDSEVIRNYKNIVDTWRQKYNDPIQVPSRAKSKMAHATVRRVNLGFHLHKVQRPEAYIRLATNSDQVAGGHKCDLDPTDTAWIKINNRKFPTQRIEPEVLEDLIYQFEQRVFDGKARANNRIEEEKIENRVDTVCDICQLPDGDAGNEIVFCDGCDAAMHQLCYGIPTIPEGDWFCEPCTLKVDRKVCDLCPVEGGALRQTTQRGTLAHVLCAQWIPEVPVSVDEVASGKKGPLIDISRLPADRRRLTCTVCKTKQGACIQCQMPTCTTSFHAKCAVDSKFRMDLLLTDEGDIIRKAFCPRHADFQVEEQVLMTVGAKAGGGGDGHHGKQTEFCDHVDVAQVTASGTDLNLDRDLVNRVYAYWVQKRRRQKGRPLLRQFVQNKEHRRASKGQSRRGQEHQSLQRTRLSLERGRTICDMVRRRESKKRQLYRLMQQEFLTSARTFAASLGVDISDLLHELFWSGDDAHEV